MKKIIILLSALLLFTGCYDYNELNDIAVISGMAVAYKDNKYEITLEIINAKKSDSNESNQTGTMLVSATGSTPSAAINNATAKVDKISLFSHLQIVILDESVAKKGIKEISNYLFREIHISNNFYYIIAEDTDAKEILKVKIKNEPVVTNALLNLFNNSNDVEMLDLNNEFDDLFAQIKDGKSDIVIPSVKLNKNNLALGTLGIFKKDKLIDYLSKEESQTYYLLKSQVENSLFYTNDTAISVYQNKTKYKVTDDTINIKLSANALIKCLNEETNLREGFKNRKLSKYYSKVLKTNIKKLIEKSIETDSDFLGINTKYYQQAPKQYQKDIYKLIKYKVEVDLEVNRNGQTYEVIDW